MSIWLGLEDGLAAVTSGRPTSVLDAGIGFGLWGHLLRQYLDVWEGRIQREQWRVRIDGIEIDAQRVQPHSRHLYDEVHVGDIRTLLPGLGQERAYDVMILGDVLEHLPKSDGVQLMRQAAALAARQVIIRIPLGDGWRRCGREPPDHHRSLWSAADFNSCVAAIRKYNYYGNPYALVVVDAPATRARILRAAEQRLHRVEEQLRRLAAKA